MGGERGADGAAALDHVEGAGGEAGLGEDLRRACSAPSGVSSEGLKIMALPQASAGAAFQQAIWLG